MIIEFAGIPGSGKSTAAEHLAIAARDQGFETRTITDLRPGARGRNHSLFRRISRPAGFAASMIARPRLAWTVVRALAASRRTRAEKVFAFRHVWVTVRTLITARHDVGAGTALAIIHEGICQRAFLTFVDGDGVSRPRLTERFLRAAPKPDLLVLLQLPPRLALERVAERGHGAISYRFDGLSEAALLERMEEGQQLLSDAAQYLTSVSPVRAIVLDGEDLAGSLERLGHEVLPGLMTELSEPGHEHA